MRLALAESVRSWILSEGTSEAALLERPLSIGRLPECDLSLAGENVSRRHAYLLPTPEGPMLVDRSQFGTWVNGERMTAPRLLADG
ncbi:MAG: FHA domain-containing protein, partial [Gemmatimonadota bacterium]|nr:FHA domain-containing protein [Gemmatimonadota bacterium]